MSASLWAASHAVCRERDVAAAKCALNVMEVWRRQYVAALPDPRVPAPGATYDPIRCVWSDGTTDEQFYRARPVGSQ